MLPAVIALLMLLSCTSGQNPAIQVILTNKGLQYGKHTGVGLIQEKLESITLPDISGEVDIKIGRVHYTLTGIAVKQCDLPEPSVQFFQDAAGFKTSSLGLNAALAGGWRTRFGIIHDGGSFDMTMFGVDVTSVVGLGKDPDGHLFITSISCDAVVGDVNINFHGGASFMFQPFVRYFKGRIRNEIQSGICSAVNGSVEKLELHLQAMNVSFDVNEVLTLDLPLTGTPIIDASRLNLGLKGEFYSIRAHKEPPFKAQPFTMPQQPDFMLSVGLSDFTLNSASYGYYSDGLLQILIDDSMIPPTSPIHLNTTYMGMFAPQLPEKFPGLLMDLQVYAREAPMFSFQSGAAKLISLVDVKAFAIEPNGTQVPLFKLNVDSKFSTKLWISGGSLKGSMTMDNFTVTLAASEVGQVKTDALERSLTVAIKATVLPKVNDALSKGWILPRMKHAQLVNSVLKMEEGFLAVLSDVEVLLTDRRFN
ncbi:bactericidal permeability-increasing protein [Acanthochromis polyacanthus]|uniref:bactericidal permeability-increasing protein n=1 Tax=Acanthochromis polyacanthus TaxID=80966 RepID=UPI000B8F2B79|nr:bactericidal permeability-increasing protein [Acanthochromis polyacanthus]XP_022058182.1 bactericidal permeability-increasing protein [Acanthochromis polyacanthus]